MLHAPCNRYSSKHVLVHTLFTLTVSHHVSVDVEAFDVVPALHDGQGVP